jgi:hypothetical protein
METEDTTNELYRDIIEVAPWMVTTVIKDELDRI